MAFARKNMPTTERWYVTKNIVAMTNFTAGSGFIVTFGGYPAPAKVEDIWVQLNPYTASLVFPFRVLGSGVLTASSGGAYMISAACQSMSGTDIATRQSAVAITRWLVGSHA